LHTRLVPRLPILATLLFLLVEKHTPLCRTHRRRNPLPTDISTSTLRLLRPFLDAKLIRSLALFGRELTYSNLRTLLLDPYSQLVTTLPLRN
jgi:hypothetical protein